MSAVEGLLAVGVDDPFREAAERLATDHGFAVRTAADPGAARDADDVDAVLAGPDLLEDGADALGALCDRSAVPAVAAYESPAGAERALAVGAARVVRTRGDADALARELAAVLSSLPGIDSSDGSGTGRGDEDPSARRDGTPAARRDDELLAAAVDRLPDLLYIFDASGRMLEWNDRFTAVTGYDDAAVAEMVPTEFIAEGDRLAIAEAIDRVLEEGEAQATAELLTADGERIPYEFTGALLEDDPPVVAGIGRDVTDRRRRERVLERQADRLETLNHVNAVIRDVTGAIVRAETRAEVESAVCEGLADASPYAFAWIGELDVRGESVEPRAWAGAGEDYLADRPSDPEEGVTAATAIEEDEVKVAQRIATDPTFASWREAALDRGFRSAAAVPLTYRGLSYGVLCVYAPRSEAFGETERQVLAELGETVAYAINAAERRRALVSDTVIDLELSLGEPGPFVVDASAAADCRVALDGVGETEGELKSYVRFPASARDAVADLASDAAEEFAVVAAYDDDCVARVVPAGPSIAGIVADQGGVLRDARAESGDGTARVELPGTADVRAAVSRIRQAYPGVEARAQHERERTRSGRPEYRDALDERLTDRQREVLETAYHSGFFEWPRGCTAEEVADQLGIAAPTFHEHLRRVHRKLADAYLGAVTGPERPE